MTDEIQRLLDASNCYIADNIREEVTRLEKEVTHYKEIANTMIYTANMIIGVQNENNDLKKTIEHLMQCKRDDVSNFERLSFSFMEDIRNLQAIVDRQLNFIHRSEYLIWHVIANYGKVDAKNDAVEAHKKLKEALALTATNKEQPK